MSKVVRITKPAWLIKRESENYEQKPLGTLAATGIAIAYYSHIVWQLFK